MLAYVIDATVTTRSAAYKLAVGMAISGTVGAFGVQARLDPVSMVFWRSVFGTAFLLVWCLVVGCLPDRSMTPRKFGLSVAAGSCLVLSWAAFFTGIERTSIATTTILFHVQPFFVILIGAVVLRERVTRDQVSWMVLAFLGLILASGVTWGRGAIDGSWALGVGVSILGALCYAGTAVLGKLLEGQRPEVTALCQTMMGVMLFAPLVDFGQPIAAASWGWLLGIGVIHSGIAWVIIYGAYPKVPTPTIAALSFVYPVVAILIDWGIYKHPLGLAQATGTTAIATATLGIRLGWRLRPDRVTRDPALDGR